jgi:hypothetical protein
MTTKTMPSWKAPQVERRVRTGVVVEGRPREVDLLVIRAPAGWIFGEIDGRPSYSADTLHGPVVAALAEATDDEGWPWIHLEIVGSEALDIETLVSVITTFLGPGRVGLIQADDWGDRIRFHVRCGRVMAPPGAYPLTVEGVRKEGRRIARARSSGASTSEAADSVPESGPRPTSSIDGERPFDWPPLHPAPAGWTLVNQRQSLFRHNTRRLVAMVADERDAVGRWWRQVMIVRLYGLVGTSDIIDAGVAFLGADKRVRVALPQPVADADPRGVVLAHCFDDDDGPTYRLTEEDLLSWFDDKLPPGWREAAHDARTEDDMRRWAVEAQFRAGVLLRGANESTEPEGERELS